MLPVDIDKSDGLSDGQPPAADPHSGGNSQLQPASNGKQHRTEQANSAANGRGGVSVPATQAAPKPPAELEGTAKCIPGSSEGAAFCGGLGGGCGSAGGGGDGRGHDGRSYDSGSIILNESPYSQTLCSGVISKNYSKQAPKSNSLDIMPSVLNPCSLSDCSKKNYLDTSALPSVSSKTNPDQRLETTGPISRASGSESGFLLSSCVEQPERGTELRKGSHRESTNKIPYIVSASSPYNPPDFPKLPPSKAFTLGVPSPSAPAVSLLPLGSIDNRISDVSVVHPITPAVTDSERKNVPDAGATPHGEQCTASGIARPVADGGIQFVPIYEAPFSADSGLMPTTITGVLPNANAEVSPMANTEAPPTTNTEALPIVNTEAPPAVNTEAPPTVNTEAPPTTNTEAPPTVNTEAPPTTNAEGLSTSNGQRSANAGPPNRRPPPPNNLNALRERMFHSLFLRLSVAYARCTTPQIRRLFEFVLLMKSLVCLTLLVVVHWLLGSRAPACLPPDTAWDSSGILRVEVVRAAGGGYSLWQSYRREELLQRHLMLEAGAGLLAALAERAGALDLEALEEELDSALYPGNTSTDGTCKAVRPPNPLLLHAAPTCLLSAADADEHYEEILIAPPHIMEYALEYGLLRLSSAARQRLKVPVTLVVLDPDEHPCFGDPGTSFLIEEVIGYDELLLASLKQLAESDGGKGYLRNAMTGEHFRFVSLWLAGSSYVGAALVMLVFTLSVSLLLRYSHHQIFLFIVHLLHVMEMNTGAVAAFPAAPLLTVVLALVGMEAIMSEFFKDTSTAFYIIVLVWLCDQYEALCCTQPITRKHWIRFFYLYHFAFYAYHYRFNGQYSWLALMTSWFFLQHSMLFFFHHYELPAMLRSRPRLQAVNIVIRRPVPAAPPQEPP